MKSREMRPYALSLREFQTKFTPTWVAKARRIQPNFPQQKRRQSAVQIILVNGFQCLILDDVTAKRFFQM